MNFLFYSRKEEKVFEKEREVLILGFFVGGSVFFIRLGVFEFEGVFSFRLEVFKSGVIFFLIY